MKAEVVKAYQDRITRELHLVGEVVELDAERAKELGGGGFVKPRPARRKAPAKE